MGNVRRVQIKEEGVGGPGLFQVAIAGCGCRCSQENFWTFCDSANAPEGGEPRPKIYGPLSKQHLYFWALICPLTPPYHHRCNTPPNLELEKVEPRVSKARVVLFF